MNPVKSATDQHNNDVTQKVAGKDGNYVHSFPLTTYQGLAKNHYIELNIGNNTPNKGSRKILAYGWVYPTDTSLNIALNQNDHKPLYGVRVKVPDGKGCWKIVRKGMGFPSGKNKTMIIITSRESLSLIQRIRCVCIATWRFTGTRFR